MASTLQERFSSKVQVTGGCWEWTGAKNSDGYGNLMVGPAESPTGKHSWPKAHRTAWFLAWGEWPPPDKMLCHTCDNPACVNVAHLFLGDQFDNMRDKTSKGRHHNKRKTHCKQGHPFSGDNLLLQTHRGFTRRVCVTCKKERRHR